MKRSLVKTDLVGDAQGPLARGVLAQVLGRAEAGGGLNPHGVGLSE